MFFLMKSWCRGCNSLNRGVYWLCGLNNNADCEQQNLQDFRCLKCRFLTSCRSFCEVLSTSGHYRNKRRELQQHHQISAKILIPVVFHSASKGKWKWVSSLAAPLKSCKLEQVYSDSYSLKSPVVSPPWGHQPHSQSLKKLPSSTLLFYGKISHIH